MTTTNDQDLDVTAVLGNAGEAMSVNRVFGAPITYEDIQVIPVAKVRGGGGGGGGESPDGTGRGRGAGFGIADAPAGVYVLKGGDATWKPAINPERIALSALGLIAFALLVVRSVLVRRGG